RNEADGTVTAVFHGAVAAVQAMIDECRDGPPSAMVDHLSVDHVDEAPTGPFRISRL
ncbi:MAG: acylphosphatase, partial [Pseudomonadota bacterium]